MNIYINGVGGQGTGMLSEILVRAIDLAGINFRAVDTHGLAQRGGTVVSQIRYGENVYTPLIRKGDADLVISMELHEAFRGSELFLKKKGNLIFYHAIWEPLGVRMGVDKKLSLQDIRDLCLKRDIVMNPVVDENLDDTRMQNIVILSGLVNKKIIKEINSELIEEAMSDLMGGTLLEKNLEVFRRNLN